VIESVQDNIIGNCLCVLGDSMAMPISSMVKKFRGEFEEYIAARRQATERVAGGTTDPRDRTDVDLVGVAASSVPLEEQHPEATRIEDEQGSRREGDEVL
jgi:hypothetical protein